MYYRYSEYDAMLCNIYSNTRAAQTNKYVLGLRMKKKNTWEKDMYTFLVCFPCQCSSLAFIRTQIQTHLICDILLRLRFFFLFIRCSVGFFLTGTRSCMRSRDSIEWRHWHSTSKKSSFTVKQNILFIHTLDFWYVYE